ncbi:hypothetical protein AAG570_006192 [Ranatra chinensis]|uniref:Tim44-like domain-containing protein n=1 Tax=Ranatra chinensis TaxID=642074 RepID=A0ABD0YCC6_9HEMI
MATRRLFANLGYKIAPMLRQQRREPILSDNRIEPWNSFRNNSTGSSNLKHFMKKFQDDLERKKQAIEIENLRTVSLLRKNVDAYKNDRCDPDSAEPNLATGQNNPASDQDEGQVEASDIKDCDSDKNGSFLMDKVREMLAIVEENSLDMRPSPTTEMKFATRSDSIISNDKDISQEDSNVVEEHLPSKSLGQVNTPSPTWLFTITETDRANPAFPVEGFLYECSNDLIPKIMGAQLSGDMDLVQEWCTGQALAWYKAVITEYTERGFVSCSRLLSVENLEFLSREVREDALELKIRFTATQITCMKNKMGKVFGGGPREKIRIGYIWTLCRDVQKTGPKAAWRLSAFMVTLPQ